MKVRARSELSRVLSAFIFARERDGKSETNDLYDRTVDTTCVDDKRGVGCVCVCRM